MKEFELLNPKDTEELILKAQNGDKDASQKLVQANYPLIKSIVKRYLRKNLEYDDLYQLGSVGFLKAIINFNPEFGVKFSTYAVPMIAGEIKRFLRDDGEIKISRSIKQLSIKISAYIEQQQALGNPSPTTKELAEKFNVDEQEVVVAIDSAFCLISLYEKTMDRDDSSPNLIDKIASVEEEDKQIEKIMLKKLLEELPDREKKILLFEFFLYNI